VNGEFVVEQPTGGRSSEFAMQKSDGEIQVRTLAV